MVSVQEGHVASYGVYVEAEPSIHQRPGRGVRLEASRRRGAHITSVAFGSKRDLVNITACRSASFSHGSRIRGVLATLFVVFWPEASGEELQERDIAKSMSSGPGFTKQS